MFQYLVRIITSRTALTLTRSTGAAFPLVALDKVHGRNQAYLGYPRTPEPQTLDLEGYIR